jgi:hypothetical protein
VFLRAIDPKIRLALAVLKPFGDAHRASDRC